MMTQEELDKDILQCLLNGWAESDGRRTYGHVTYSDMQEFAERHGLEIPHGLQELLDGSWLARVRAMIGEIDEIPIDE